MKKFENLSILILIIIINIFCQVTEEIQRITEEIEATCENRVNEIKEHLRASERRLMSSMEATKQAHDATERCQSQLLLLSKQTDERISSLQVNQLFYYF